MSNNLIPFENSDIKFTNPPVLIAAWPGVGNVGLVSVDYIRRKLQAKPLGGIDVKSFFMPHSGLVENGRFITGDAPFCSFYYSTSPDVIIMESNIQMGGTEGVFLLQKVFGVARQYNVKQILTVSAIPYAMSHTENSQLYFAANSKRISKELRDNGISPLMSGEINGLPGAVPVIASSKGLDSACILATMPVYAGNFTYPKAALPVISSISDIINCSIDLDEVKKNTDNLNGQFEQIESQIKEQLPNLLGGEKRELQKELEQITSESIISEQDIINRNQSEKIEQMFEQVKKDRSKGIELKKLLDEMGVYRDYEDRFLDLFNE
ncbi:PAC2 family protein [Chitinispirillales bacterium ANBcel5]|uniref:PAC2 family protein n=1 Tax=Cellulosispirillum alkaliphilum TaxID=3039283 RepID=UPI002A51C557|nr:PAC2 family protein [Chitinispirillales bacterium ANBcel5]